METPRQETSGCGRTFAYAFAGAAIVGLVSFGVGVFGPIVFTPEANQGPLLGIFITGPAGAIVGFIIGAVYSRFRRPKS